MVVGSGGGGRVVFKSYKDQSELIKMSTKPKYTKKSTQKKPVTKKTAKKNDKVDLKKKESKRGD